MTGTLHDWYCADGSHYVLIKYVHKKKSNANANPEAALLTVSVLFNWPFLHLQTMSKTSGFSTSSTLTT